MNATAIVRHQEIPIIDAVFVEDTGSRRDVMRRVGVGQTSTVTFSPMSVGFIAAGSAVAGFALGYLVCGILERS